MNIPTGYTSDSPFTGFSGWYNRFKFKFTPHIVCYTRRHKLHANYYFFTNIKPALIIVTHPAAHQNKPTAQQAATQDPISQHTHPLQPGKTRVYPSMLTNKQVPVLNLTETSITSQADLQDAFQSLCLCSHGGKESTEDQSTE